MLRKQATFILNDLEECLPIRDQAIHQNLAYKQVLQIYSTFGSIQDIDLIRTILPIMSKVDFFVQSCPKDMPIQDFAQACLPSLNYEFFPRGRAVFHLGDKGDKFYIILKGIAGLFVLKDQASICSEHIKKVSAFSRKNTFRIEESQNKKNQQEFDGEEILRNYPTKYFTKTGICRYYQIRSMIAGQSFGDVALTTDKPRGASIFALEDLHLLSLTKQSYKQLFEDQIQTMKNKISRFHQLLPEAQIFNIQKFIQYFKDAEFPHNTIIWNQGDIVRSFFLIESGYVEIYLSDSRNQMTRIAIMGENNFIGDDDVILKRQYRQFSCRTQTATKLHFIVAKDYDNIRKYYQDIEKQLKQIIQLKIEWNSERIQQIKTTQEMISNKSKLGLLSPSQLQYERQHPFFYFGRITSDDIEKKENKQKFLQISQPSYLLRSQFLRSKKKLRASATELVEIKSQLQSTMKNQTTQSFSNFIEVFNQKGQKEREMLYAYECRKRNLHYHSDSLPRNGTASSVRLKTLPAFFNRFLKTQFEESNKAANKKSILFLQ